MPNVPEGSSLPVHFHFKAGCLWVGTFDRYVTVLAPKKTLRSPTVVLFCFHGLTQGSLLILMLILSSQMPGLSISLKLWRKTQWILFYCIPYATCMEDTDTFDYQLEMDHGRYLRTPLNTLATVFVHWFFLLWESSLETLLSPVGSLTG